MLFILLFLAAVDLFLVARAMIHIFRFEPQANRRLAQASLAIMVPFLGPLAVMMLHEEGDDVLRSSVDNWPGESAVDPGSNDGMGGGDAGAGE